MCKINLFHGESNFRCRYWSTDNKLTHLVIYPVPMLMVAICIIKLSFIYTAFAWCLLTIWSGQLKLHRFNFPTMGVFKIAYTASKPFGKPSKVKPKGENINISRKWKAYLPIHFKPPYLLQVCHSVEPEKCLKVYKNDERRKRVQHQYQDLGECYNLYKEYKWNIGRKLTSFK